MQLSSNKSLNEIYFYVTDRCNLRCCHCWINPIYLSPNTEPSLTSNINVSDFESLIEQGKQLGLKSVKFTGGEPLLHPLINDFISICKSENISIQMETNGTLCANSFIENITGIDKISISVSLDGSTRDIHDKVRGVPGSFDLAVQGIKNLVNSNIRPQIIMTVMKHNVHQIESLVDLAVKLKASSVALNIVQPISRGENLHMSGLNIPINDLISIGDFIENNLSEVTPIPIYYGHPPAFRPLHKLYEFDSDGCGSCGIKNVIGILSDGSYSICGIGKSHPEFILGHLKKDKLSDIWNNHQLLNKIRNELPSKLEGVCGICLMKNLCLGKCVVQNHKEGSNLWKGFWYCQEAYDKKLFPVSRLQT